MIGFAAAVVGARVSASTQLAPDKTRPIGYAADESIYATFRALSLLGLVAFAAGSAVLNIVNYAGGGEIPDLSYGPILVYFVVIGDRLLRAGRKSSLRLEEDGPTKRRSAT